MAPLRKRSYLTNPKGGAVNQLTITARLILVGIFLLVVVVGTALVDMNLHFNPLVVIAIMLIATLISAQVIVSHSE